MNIILVGMMGSGKSTVAKQLANTLNYTALDIDYLIEQEQGCSISQIFLYAGEDFFRGLETKMIKKYFNRRDIIISTGGGILMRDGNMEILKQIGSIVYLKADADKLFERIKGGRGRPLVKLGQQREFVKLFEQRKAMYEQADFIVDTDNISAKQVAENIMRHFELLVS